MTNNNNNNSNNSSNNSYNNSYNNSCNNSFNNSSNNSSNNSYNNSCNNDLNYLFYKCFHNQFIRYQIIKHLRLFNIHQNIKLVDYKNYKYRYYLTSIIFEKYQDVDQDLSLLFQEDSLPPNLHSIIFSFYFNKIINSGHFTSSCSNLTSITFTSDFNKPILEHTLPPTIKYLKLGRLYNQKLVDGGLNSYRNLDTIIFGAKFNNGGQQLQLSLFPDSCSKLKFGSEFNCDLLPGTFPSNLKILKLGMSYRKPIKIVNVLPISLTVLKVSSHIGCYLSSEILSSLINLKSISLLYTPLNYIDLEALSPSLTSLTFGASTINISQQSYNLQLIPSNIRIIKGPLFEYSIPPPPELEVLDLGSYFNSPLNINQIIDQYNSYFKSHLNKKHQSLSSQQQHQQLSLQQQQQQNQDNNYFNNLKLLKFGSFNREILNETILSNSITKLVLGDTFNSEISALPQSLTYLSVGDTYNLEFKDNVLPLGLNTLILGSKWLFKVPSKLLKLASLVVPDNYKYSFDSGGYPSLENLYFKPNSINSGSGSKLIQYETIEFYNRFLMPVSSTLKSLQLTRNQVFSVPLNHSSLQHLSLPSINTLSIEDNSSLILDYNEPHQFKELIVNRSNQVFLNNINNINQFINILKVS